MSLLVELPANVTADTKNIYLVEDETASVPANTIQPFKLSDWSLRYIISVDASGSMTSSGDMPLSETQDALKTLFAEGGFRSQDRVALIAFEDRSRILHWFDDKAEDAEEAIDRLVWLGGQKTILYQSLYESLEHLEHVDDEPRERRRILVISDGKDEGSEKTFTEVREKALEMGVQIDVVARVRKDRVEEDLLQGFAQDIRALADETGGVFAYAEPGGVFDGIKQIVDSVMLKTVVEFSRDIDPEHRKTQRVGVLLRDETDVVSTIPAEIPKTRRPLTWIWLLELIGGLLILTVVVMVWRRQAGTKIESDVVPVGSGQPEPSIEKNVAPDRGRGETIVSEWFPKPSSGHPAAVLLGTSGPPSGKRVAIEKSMFRIGANADNDLCIEDDEYVSDHHAHILYQRGSLLLYDEHSTNGTYLNDDRLKDKAAAVHLGNRIRVGKSSFKVVDGESG